MSDTSIDIDRITVTLYGVPLADAENAATTFASLLRQRLAGWCPDVAAPADLGSINLGSVAIDARLDAPALTRFLADRLIAQLDGIFARRNPSEEDV